MSVQNEIDRINNNIANTYTTLNEAGATMPETRNSNNLSATAASISAVLFNKAQNLTAAQQQQARDNIGVEAIEGPQGPRGTGILKITTAPSSYTTATGGFTPTYRISLSTVKTQSKVSSVIVGDVLQYNYYQYPVGYVDSSYVYTGARTSIRGATGAPGADGNGILSVVQTTTSTADGGSNILTITEDDGTTNTFTVRNGSKGSTPVKGTDYYTPADQESIVQQVIAALGTPIFGTVDENKHITLSGHLADGTYTLSFEDTDGFTAELCTLNKSSGPSYTNQIPISIDADGSVFNGKGWIGSKRLNSSGGVVDVGSYGDSAVTGFIPFKDGDTLRGSAGVYLDSGSSQQGICFYKSDKTFVHRMAQTSVFPSAFKAASDGSFEFTLSAAGDFSHVANMENIAYVRCCFCGIDDDAIITKNEEIV